MGNLAFRCLAVAAIVTVAPIWASAAAAQGVANLPAPAVDLHMDVATDTPLGQVRSGGDLSAALQWALDNLQFHKRAILIPAGEWQISKTIRTPFKSGLTLVGAGFGGTDADLRLIGSRTLLKWTGTPGGTMIEFCGSDATIGNFTLMGTGAEKGIVVLNPAPGLGIGSVRFAPIQAYRLDTVVQCGATLNDANCDNLHFEWLGANKCKCVYRGVNAQGMDIVIERLSTMSTPIGIEMLGGGSLWVQYSTVIHAATLLKIPNGDGVGKYNGWFRLSNTKVDSQARDGFCLVDSEEPYPIRILADGGLYSNDQAQGTFARISGRNHLEIRDWTATFRTIEGVEVDGHRPTVVLRGSRLWKPVDEVFTGAINARVRDGVTTQGSWIDWDSKPAP